jgi:large subunit ribosomal protein L30
MATSTPARKRLAITQIRSGIGFDRKQRRALQGLGLRRLRHTVRRADTPETRGLILQVRHLVEVTDADGPGSEES